MASTETTTLLHRVKEELLQLNPSSSEEQAKVDQLVNEMDQRLQNTDSVVATSASSRKHSTAEPGEKIVEMKNISISFGGIKAVDNVSVDLHKGEVVGLVGHNGAGKTVLIKILSGALKPDQGEIYIRGEKARINKPMDARKYGIETIYQTLALADNVDTAGNLFLGRELLTRSRTLDDLNMEARSREVMHKLNPRFERFNEPVRALSGGQRQSVAIARAILFDAQILIMDEPTAALGPHEAAQVGDLIKKLKGEGISIFLISHDMHDVFDLVDRVVVLKNGQTVGTASIGDVSQDDVLGMIILGKCPSKAIPGPGAVDIL